MPHDVFISHSMAGKLTASAICSQLESAGIRCWILPRDLLIDSGWDQSITKAVMCCRIMIVVLSNYASRSDRIERQLELAFNHGVIVIPFRIDSNSVVSEPQSSQDSVHWLDAVNPEMTERLKSLCDLVWGLILREKADRAPDRILSVVQDQPPDLSNERLPEPSPHEATMVQPRLPGNGVVAESHACESEKGVPPADQGVDATESEIKKPSLEQPKKPSNWEAIKALLFMLLPFAIICVFGVWQVKKGHKSTQARPTAATTPSIAAPLAVKIQHQDKFEASDPGWGIADANWAIADGKLQVTPLLNSSAVLINHSRGFTDAEISADVVMSKGEDLSQLGGLIFWAKDHNDCYALVVSADGKFAVGRKLIGRWINPIAKTGNVAIKTGIGQTNRLGVRMEGTELRASINNIQVATMAGEAPSGVSYIGLYGESAETTQNVWEFTNVTVTTVH
jgi:hypothetical protein